MNQTSLSNAITEILGVTKAVLCDAAKPVQTEQTHKPSLSTRLCNWAKNAEQDRQRFDRQQHIMQQQQMLAQASLSLKHLLAYALNCMPSHLDFWGNLSPHSIHLRYVNGVWTFPLVHSLDAHEMPVTFHQTAAELQEIVSDIYANATHVLSEKIRTDAELYAAQFWEQCHGYSNWTKNGLDFVNGYTTQYRAYSDYLWQISGMAMAPTSNGVTVSFIATFNDCGLSPAYYWQNMRCVSTI